jgi:capsular exopolysaccharide synthesis family protein
MRRDGWNVLGVTSAGSKEGKSLTAANLAISMAREPETTVLLVDADLRNPSLHRYFGVDVEWGLADYLRSDLPIEDVLIAPGIERLLVLPGKSAVADSSELLGSRKMAALINECKSRYEIGCIIVDLPPILVGDDALVLSPCLDAALLVVDEGRTLAHELTRSLELLDRVKIIGTVLNRSSDSARSYRNTTTMQIKSLT